MAQYEVTLRDYWRILRRRKGIVLFTAFLLSFFSFLIASVWKPLPLYKATSKVQIQMHQSMTGLYLQSIAYNSGDQIETQQTIITSHPVLRRTAAALGMLSWAKTPEDSGQVLTDLIQRISTNQEGFTNIIAISATDRSPGRARDLANTLARTYRDFDHEQKNQQAVNHRQFVERQREQARRTLMEAEEEVRAYREDSELISLDSQASVNLQGMTNAEREVQRLEEDLEAMGAMVREMEADEVLSDQTLQGAQARRVGETFMALSRQLNDLKLQRDALLVQLTDDHPNVRQVQVKIVQLGRDLLGELQQRRSATQRDLQAERARLAKLRDQYNQLPSQGLELGRKQREVTLRQEVVTALEQSYQEALIREADKVEEVTILESALTPTLPVNPHHPLQRALMGLLLGLVLGVVFAVVAETLDTSIGTIEDVQEYTGTQVVGIIPFIDVDDVRASLQRRGVDVSDERTVQRKAQLVAYFDPQSTLAETYRTLRTNIEFVTVEKGAKCLMVTSSMHYEGKSTTIANLSMTMAQLGKRTLLVDCDLRKPSTARLFGLDKEPGVTEVVVGNFQWRDVVRTVTDIVTGGMGMEDILQTQGISNLHIITSGAIPPNPAELLNSRRMAEFLAEVRAAYDVVLIDTPPVLHVTDAAILGKKVDGALMVYKAGDVARTSLKRSTSLLRSVDIDLLGVVLNGIRADMSSDYQDLGYNAYYAYGSELAAPERTVEQRLKDWVRRSKRKLGVSDDGFDRPRRKQTWEREGDPEREVREVGERGAAAHGGAAQDAGVSVADPQDGDEQSAGAGQASGARRAAALAALLVVVAGTLWQSGAWIWALSVAGEGPPAPPADMPPPAAQATRVPPPTPLAPPPSSTPGTAAIAAGTARGSATAPLKVVLADAPYTVRVASYPRGSRWAEANLEALRQRGEPAYLSPVEVRGQVYERLLLGRFSSFDEAHRHARQLKEAGGVEDFTVVRLPYALSREPGSEPRWADHAPDPEASGVGAFATPGEAEALRDHLRP